MGNWTESRVAWLTEYYPILGPTTCAKTLNLTVGAVQMKARHLGFGYSLDADKAEVHIPLIKAQYTRDRLLRMRKPHLSDAILELRDENEQLKEELARAKAEC
jgi:hypothetical protein